MKLTKMFTVVANPRKSLNNCALSVEELVWCSQAKLLFFGGKKGKSLLRAPHVSDFRVRDVTNANIIS